MQNRFIIFQIHQFQIELQLKYAGYLERQETEIAKLQHVENIRISPGFDFDGVCGLRTEAKQKLSQVNPQNLGQASRIPGISPTDISVLMIALKKSNE